jgi:hypothetical protein
VTVSQKAALSLLISIFLFAGFAVLAYTGLFDLIETRFYDPSVTRAMNREIAGETKTIETFLAELETRFSATLAETSIQRSFLPNQSAEDIFERTRIYGTLIESLGGLQWVRFVDSGGSRLHFSTYGPDIFSQDRLSIAFRNYTDDETNLPYEQVAVEAGASPRLIMDDRGDRIIFAFPFHDSFDVYRGTALFSLSIRALSERLIAEGRAKIGEDIAILPEPPGIISGIPGSNRRAILSSIASIWSGGILSLTALDSADSGVSLALIAEKTNRGIIVGRVINEALFSFPDTMKIILLVSFFLTIYLTIFLFFNLKQDTMMVVQNRLKSLQISLIEQYYDRKGDVDWNHWSRELEQRRDDIRAEVKRGIRIPKGKRADEDINTLIDKSWDELLSVIGGQKAASPGFDEEKIQNILNRILQAAPALGGSPQIQIQQAPAAVIPAAASVQEAEEDALEELEELVEEPEEAAAGEAEESGGPRGAAPAGQEAEEDALEEIGDLVEEPEEAGTEGKAPAPKKSNVRLAFSDDDIPYIVETSGLELVDEDVDLAMSMAQQNEDAGELEELDAADLEELVEEEEPKKSPGASPAPEGPDSDIAEIASQIEFSPLPEEEDIENAIDTELEIVSPFATMLSNVKVEEPFPQESGFSDAVPEENPPKDEGKDKGQKKKS